MTRCSYYTVVLFLLFFIFHHSESTGDNYGYIWIMTDVHYDPTYWTTQQSCNKDIPPADLGRFGDVECDPPWELVESAVNAMWRLERVPDMIYWLGDTSHHDKTKSLNADRIYTAVRNCTQLIKQQFPETDVFPILGNHDFYPINDLPPSGNNQYDRILDLWQDWLTGCDDIDTFRRVSYYTKLYSRTLRVVALNTNLYLTNNEEVTRLEEEAGGAEIDPGEQLTWLTKVLQQAAQHGEKVQIIAHVPFGFLENGEGVHWIKETYNRRLVNVIREHGDVIVGIHAGHEHMDGFRLVYNSTDSPKAAMMMAPSVTPWRARITPTIIKQARNPALRVIKYDTRTLRMVDIEQFYVNLTKANMEGSVEWELEYTFSDDYGLAEVTAESVHGLLDLLKKNGTFFNKYYQYNTVLVDHPESVPASCDCPCRRNHLCSMQHVDFSPYYQCLRTWPHCPGVATSSTASLALLALAVFTHWIMNN